MRYSTYGLIFGSCVPLGLLLEMGGAVLNGNPEWGDWRIALACIAYVLLLLWRMRADMRAIDSAASEVKRLEAEVREQGDLLWRHWAPLHDDAANARVLVLRTRGCEIANSILYREDDHRPHSERFAAEMRWLRSRATRLQQSLRELAEIHRQLSEIRWQRAREVHSLAGAAIGIALIVVRQQPTATAQTSCQCVFGATVTCFNAWKRIRTAEQYAIVPAECTRAEWDALDQHGNLLAATLSDLAEHAVPSMEFDN